MIGFATIPLGAGGVLPCVRCCPESRRVRQLRDTSDVIADVSRLALQDGRPDGVWLDGVEPFAHPGLPDAVAAAVAGGFVRVRLTTDAGALADTRTVTGVLGAGVRHLEVVVLGDADAHDALSGRPGLHAAMTAGVEAFMRTATATGRRVSVSGLVRVCAHNRDVAARAVADVAALGAHCVCVDATNAPRAAGDTVRAALETAAANGCAGFVAGFDGEVPRPQERAPWTAWPVGG